MEFDTLGNSGKPLKGPSFFPFLIPHSLSGRIVTILCPGHYSTLFIILNLSTSSFHSGAGGGGAPRGQGCCSATHSAQDGECLQGLGWDPCLCVYWVSGVIQVQERMWFVPSRSVKGSTFGKGKYGHLVLQMYGSPLGAWSWQGCGEGQAGATHNRVN